MSLYVVFIAFSCKRRSVDVDEIITLLQKASPVRIANNYTEIVSKNIYTCIFIYIHKYNKWTWPKICIDDQNQ